MVVLFFDNYSLNQLNQKYDFGVKIDDCFKNYIGRLDIDSWRVDSEKNVKLYKDKLNYEFQISSFLKEYDKDVNK